MFFKSDNTAALCPEVMQALIDTNGAERNMASYGDDSYMPLLTQNIRRIFEAPEAIVHLVSTGTAANALALACLVHPWQSVLCHQNAHIAVDECGAPEFFTAGAKLALLEGKDGKISPQTLQKYLHEAGGHGVHTVSPAALSLTNITEKGALYTPEEIRELTHIAHHHGLACHLDGARFANAVVGSGATPAQLATHAGIDILSLGATKNGCAGVEAVVLFNPSLDEAFQRRRKRAGHLLSKNRFAAAQMQAYLSNDTWLRHAKHANDMARQLADGLSKKTGVRLISKAQGNMLFVEWPLGIHARLHQNHAQYYIESPQKPRTEAARLVTSWSTTLQDIEHFLALF